MRYRGEELQRIRAACKLAAQGLTWIAPQVRPGVTTNELDKALDRWYSERGGRPAALGYRSTVLGVPAFPKSICASIDNEVCHGIPSDRVLRSGTIVKLDVAVELDGFFGDTAATFYVGDVPLHLRHLVEVTRQCLDVGIALVRPGARLGDIGHAIEQCAARKGCTVVRDFTGHGVGRQFHEAPTVLHFGFPETGETLKEGTVFTLEPMVNLGGHEVRMLHDGWTAVTKDGTPSAQFEHTILVTADGHEVLTERSDVLAGSEDVSWCRKFGAEAACAS